MTANAQTVYTFAFNEQKSESLDTQSPCSRSKLIRVKLVEICTAYRIDDTTMFEFPSSVVPDGMVNNTLSFFV